MGKINVKYEPPTVELADKEYTIKKSITEIMVFNKTFEAMIDRVIESCGRDRKIIYAAMQCGLEMIDAILGKGTLSEIADGKPINLPRIMEIINKIVSTAGSAYTEYNRREYGAEGAFSLMRAKMPDHIYSGGKRYAIQTDFRKILLVLKAIGDPNLEEFTRTDMLHRHFYKGDAPENAEDAFIEFVNCGKDDRESSGRKDFDFEQDAAEIYSAFMQVYGLDLFSVEDMHWWRFSALLDGVCVTENALANKIQLRHMDDSEGEKKASAERAKRNAELKMEVSGSEKAIQEEMMERLKKGQDISDLMKGR